MATKKKTRKKRGKRHPTQRQKQVKKIAKLVVTHELKEVEILQAIVEEDRRLGYTDVGPDLRTSDPIIAAGIKLAMEVCMKKEDVELITKVARLSNTLQKTQDARKNSENRLAEGAMNSNVYRELMALQRKILAGDGGDDHSVEATCAAVEQEGRPRG